MSYGLDLVALTASCLALYFIIRAKKTFFLDSGFFIGAATVGFTLYLADATYSDVVNAPVSIVFATILIAFMGSSIGVASYLLTSSDPKGPSGVRDLKRFVAKPPAQFLIFLSVIMSWTFSALIGQPWILDQISLGPTTYYYYVYPSWFIAASLVLLISFIGLPVLSFYRQSRIVRERTASTSMKIISSCWALFALSLFLQIIAGGFLLPASQSIGFVGDSFLFVLIAFALREPTILARIVTGVETVDQLVSMHSENDTIVLYNTDSDRKKLIETFVKDGLASGHNVLCRVTKPEIPFYRAVLKSSDLQESPNSKGRVKIQAIEQGSSPSDSATETSDSHNHKELVDLDELDLERSREIIQSLDRKDGPGAQILPGRIWALNVEGAQTGILDLLTLKSPKSRVIDLAKQQDAFSNLLNLRHDAILGSRLLLEYDPTSNYEDVVQKFVREFQANVEPIALFTNAGSPLYRQFNEQRNVRLFSFSTKTSTPARLSAEQVLLPERDTSLLLDAVDKLLHAYSGRRVGIIFEVFTYIILSLGFEKAYGVISSVVEMSESHAATVLMLVNSDALEPRVLSGVRGLFQTQLRFSSEGISVVRLETEQRSVSGSGSTEFFNGQATPGGLQT